MSLDKETLGLFSEAPSRDELFSANYMKALRNALREEIQVSGRKERKALYAFVSRGAEYDLRDMVVENPSLVGEKITYWALAETCLTSTTKVTSPKMLLRIPRKFKDKHISWFEQLEERDLVRTVFNTNFFTNGDSRDAELAGIWGATVGSFLIPFLSVSVSVSR